MFLVGIAERLGAQSYVELPLTLRGKLMGSLFLHSASSNAYGTLDMGFAMEIASAIAIALENCLAYERIARSRARLDAENQLLRAELRAARARSDGRGERGDARGDAPRRSRRADRCDRADQRRDGRRQGAARTADPRAQRARRTADARDQLRGDSDLADRERAIRPRGRRVHGRNAGAGAAASSSPTAARCCSTRSASSHSMHRPSYCACCRRRSSNASAAARRCVSTCA